MRVFQLSVGSICCLMLGTSLQAAEQFDPPPSVFGQPNPALPTNPDAPPNPMAPQPVPPLLLQPDLSGGFQPPGFNQPTAAQMQAQMMERMRQAEAAEEKAGPKFAAPGDDELRKLQISKYNAAFGEVRSVNAAYLNGTVSFDLLFEAQKHLLQAELELSDKPADQIAALEGYLEAAKSLEAKVKSLYYSATKGGEADKYYQAMFQRLDAEIQLLRAKRKAGLAK